MRGPSTFSKKHIRGLISSTIQLINSPASPYGRKVMVLLHDTDQLDDVDLTLAIGSPLHLEKMPLGISPLRKIPALAHDNGSALFDSRVICRFLDDRAGGKLYPAAPDLYKSLTLKSMADGVVDAAVLIDYEIRLPAWLELFTNCAQVHNHRYTSDGDNP